MICINDVPFSAQKSNFSINDGDTVISFSSKNIDELKSDLKFNLLKLQDWLHANKLFLNIVNIQSIHLSSASRIRKSENWSDP